MAIWRYGDWRHVATGCTAIVCNSARYWVIEKVISTTCWLFWQVRYTGYMDKTLHERQLYLRNDCREGHANIVSILCIICFHIMWFSVSFILVVIIMITNPNTFPASLPVRLTPSFLRLRFGFYWLLRAFTNYICLLTYLLINNSNRHIHN